MATKFSRAGIEIAIARPEVTSTAVYHDGIKRSRSRDGTVFAHKIASDGDLRVGELRLVFTLLKEQATALENFWSDTLDGGLHPFKYSDDVFGSFDICHFGKDGLGNATPTRQKLWNYRFTLLISK